MNPREKTQTSSTRRWVGSDLAAAFTGLVRPTAVIAMALIALVISGCGGGSAGTGEGLRSEGLAVDERCQPIAGIDLSTLGLPTTEQNSRADGSFALVPGVTGPVQVPTGASGTEVDVTPPVCILVVYNEGIVASVNTYPLADIPECSIDGVASVVSPGELPQCE